MFRFIVTGFLQKDEPDFYRATGYNFRISVVLTEVITGCVKPVLVPAFVSST